MTSRGGYIGVDQGVSSPSLKSRIIPYPCANIRLYCGGKAGQYRHIGRSWRGGNEGRRAREWGWGVWRVGGGSSYWSKLYIRFRKRRLYGVVGRTEGLRSRAEGGSTITRVLTIVSSTTTMIGGSTDTGLWTTISPIVITSLKEENESEME